MGWTLSQSRNDRRYSEVETFAGAALPSAFGGANTNSTGVVTTDIDANTTTVTDQAGKKRRTINNALGHLVRVDEPNDAGELGTIASPNQPTSYTYDTLNNLLTVVQVAQTRTFVYSSLSRMLSENSPEAGTTLYEFDNNGNPTKKTDSRGVSTNFTYDVLNRVTQKSYTGESGYTTPTINYTYDEYDNAIGRLTKINNGVSENKYTSFDKMGRVLTSQQKTDNQIFSLSYKYSLSGQLIEQTYPSGRKVKNSFNNSGQLAIVQSKKNSSYGYWTYADNFSYTSLGAVSSVQLGNGRWESTKFNSKSQPIQIALGTTQNTTNILKLEFDYGSTQNNGTILSQTITVPTMGQHPGFTATQTYSYDTLNRIKSATETISSSQTWKQVFLFDRFGNRTFDEDNTTTLTKACGASPNFTMCIADRKIENPTISPDTNRIIQDQDSDLINDYVFDNTGNNTRMANGLAFKFDAENKQVEVRDSEDHIIGQYFYDGGGKRVRKYLPSNNETIIFVYDLAENMIAEYSTVLSSTPKVSYTTNDHLGSPRIKTDENGEIISRSDYMPYGEEINTEQRSTGLGYKSDDVRKKFTGYERDDETDLDFAEARMYAYRLGRFTTTDPSNKSVQTINPQTWNRYTYCYNNPFTFVDDNGKWPTNTHIAFINDAFPGLTPEERTEIIEGSNRVDTYFGTGHWHDIPITMIVSEAYKHAMTPDGMTKEDAQALADQWIEDRLNSAIAWTDMGLNRRGLEEFGKAMHTLMDDTSPAHTGFQPYAYPKTGNAGLNAYIFITQGLEHKRTESGPPTPEERQKTLLTMRTHFLATYGEKEFRRAVKNQADRDEVYKYMRDNNLSFTYNRPSRINIVKKKKKDESTIE